MKKRTRMYALQFSLIVLFVLVVLRPAPTYALSCMENPERKQALKRYDAVFTGQVLALREEPTSTGKAKRMMDIHVTSKWKGIQEERVSLVYDALSTFEQGETYLIYAYKTSRDRYLFEYREGELATDGVCSRTVKLSEASYDLKQLGPAYEPQERIGIDVRTWSVWFWLALAGSLILLLLSLGAWMRRGMHRFSRRRR